MDAKETAQKRASEKVRLGSGEASGGHNPLLEESALLPKRPAIPGLTTYQDLMERYKTNIVHTPSGLTFLIHTINPGDFFGIAKAPLLKYWLEEGVDIFSPEATEKSYREMPVEKMVEIELDEKMREIAKQVVCAGVYSVNWVNKRQPECDSSKKELSIDILPMDDLMTLFTEIMALSKGEEFIPELELFRTEGENGAGEGLADTDSRNSEELRTEAEPTAVSQDTES